MLKSFYPMLQPIYPLLAQQFVDDYSLDGGIAVDIGTGPGYLGLELAKITNMEMYFLDYAPEAIEKCKANVSAWDLENHLHFIEADVASIPMDSDTVDFAMSRGSLWFWEEPVKGLQEIARILKPEGIAFIGGGLGRYAPDTMRKRLLKANREAREKRGDGPRPSLENVRQWAKEAFDGMENIEYRVISDDVEERDGKWIEIKKGVVK